jgi:choline monooxygenase
MNRYFIDPDICKAETLPASFYRDPEVFNYLKEQLFARAFHYIGDQRELINQSQNTFPISLYPGYLDESLVLVKQKDDSLKLLSNVCTHRANIIVHHPEKSRKLQCQYHGRQFKLDGTMDRMPEFEQAENFPRDCDHLHRFDLKKIGNILFAGLGNQVPFQGVIDQIMERMYFLPLDEFKIDKKLSKDYLVNCHWALYCDNYLEGFHIPFVHEDLNEALDYGSYETVLYDYMNLQIGYADGAEEVFDLPKDHPDSGKKVAAYYYWLFPNTMLNFYPWGLSVNIIKPINPDKTKVSFISYVWDESKLQGGAGALLDKVEREDEFVVEGVHKGLKSNHYTTGRFSPTREKGVHHFHRLLSELFK